MSISIIVALAAAGVTVLLGMYVFGAQNLLISAAETTIKEQNNDLKKKTDLDKALTIQNQLAKISSTHTATPVNSRVFDVLGTLLQSSGHQIAVTKLSVDSATKTVTIEGQSPEGYVALEAFKKTILNTKFEYTQQEGDKATNASEALATQVNNGEVRYGTDAQNKAVLRFSVSFTHSDKLLSRTATNGRLTAPNVTNVTDSKLGISPEMFTAPATSNQNGGKQ
jgi:hypothetical protein